MFGWLKKLLSEDTVEYMDEVMEASKKYGVEPSEIFYCFVCKCFHPKDGTYYLVGED